jgi:hypothetical protein
VNTKNASIHELFEGPLRVRGFTKVDNLLYKRSESSCDHAVAFGRRREPIGGTVFSFGVGVFHPRVHELLWPNDAEPLPYTFGMPIHLLRPSREFFEWRLSDSLDGLRGSVLEDLDNFGRPYMERLSDLQRARALLSADTWWEFFVLDPVGRTLALAAIEAVLGERSSAIFRLREHLASNEGELPKKWVAAKHLLSRIEKAT